MDLAVPADYIIKMKEYKKKDKYLYLARELKNLWIIRVMIIPIVIGAFGPVTTVWGRVETIQSTALLRTTRILRRVQET